VDEAFPGRRCSHGSRAGRGQSDPSISTVTPTNLVWDIYIERMRAAENGRVTDEAGSRACPGRDLPRRLEALMGTLPGLAGPALTLADLHAAPIFAYG